MLVHSPVPTYHFHEIARVLGTPLRHYVRVQWVFSPPVHSLASERADYKPINSVIANSWVYAETH